MIEEANTAQLRSPARFIVLVFALSVPFWLAGAAAGRLWQQLPVSALMACCPVLAAVILTRREGPAAVGRLLGRAGDWRVIPNLRWYAPIVMPAPAVMAASYLALVGLGRPLPGLRISALEVAVLAAVFVLGAAAEELGWTAYATDPLYRRWGLAAAGVALGLVWGLWHLIPYLQAGHGPVWIAGQCVLTVALRVIIVWLYVSTGSVFAAIVCHACANLAWTLFPDHGSHYDPLITGAIASAVAAVMLVGRAVGARRRR
ncbi:CPBP family intramembrane glutamic endopeptidase [Planobispora takensis]|uniref:CPBP family intramembrane glutamic endopeptidase n=1 Tax=Planobispora takensis TaxID=1367882 RepID=UPI0019404D66|nr:CPBP family intramembrane glutamic endopeptidase [Planobispora takensis]